MFRAHTWLASILLLAVLSLPAPGKAAAPVACTWSSVEVSSLNGGQPDLIDLAADYQEMYISATFPVGTTFKIKGQFPYARYFSFQVSNDLTDLLQTLSSLPDYLIAPDSSSGNPFTAINVVDTSINAGGHYTAYIVIGPQPSTPAANTLYVDPAKFPDKGVAVVTYRVYNAFNGLSVSQHGGVPLPQVYLETNHGDVPVGSLTLPPICTTGIYLVNLVDITENQYLNQLYAAPLQPAPIPAQPVPLPPVFQLRNPNSSTDFVVNRDVRYLYAWINQTSGDLVLIRAQAPTYASEAGAGTDPQLRHWSLCEDAPRFLTDETFACIEDDTATIAADGYFYTVISIPGKQPQNANAAHGFNWLPFGTTNMAAPTYRQMLPSPNYTQSAFNVTNLLNPKATMGNYFPAATYCAKTVFDTHTGNSETPAQVFAACQAGQ